MDSIPPKFADWPVIHQVNLDTCARRICHYEVIGCRRGMHSPLSAASLSSPASVYPQGLPLKYGLASLGAYTQVVPATAAHFSPRIRTLSAPLHLPPSGRTFEAQVNITILAVIEFGHDVHAVDMRADDCEKRRMDCVLAPMHVNLWIVFITRGL
ncbi:hypothetical protein OE88DRAFT_1661944 [Heliocybe sulcata]|uniref:Uncharacterized protein n=1 Tax=Heliocybe sulcata TaxID=5364 RepID=A0A5C3N8W8_9AGAM|nr:hypothetical protein OE88DRAFT_1661944 [Heliocybe sulcata]